MIKMINKKDLEVLKEEIEILKKKYIKQPRKVMNLIHSKTMEFIKNKKDADVVFDKKCLFIIVEKIQMGTTKWSDYRYNIRFEEFKIERETKEFYIFNSKQKLAKSKFIGIVN
ncbi:MAG: hypothetical protein RLZZ577_87 [Bacteroidota bacterium]|jgi:hypothetical protein